MNDCCRVIFKTLSNIQEGPFCEIVQALQPQNIFLQKSSILDVLQSSENASKLVAQHSK